MARNAQAPHGARIAEIKIRRYQPEQAPEAYWQTFQVAVEPNDRLLDALNRIKWEQDGTLTYRRSCAHGVCGSDAMRVNGRNRLACKLLMADVGQRVTVEAMLGYPVIRDLVVDMDQFFAKYEKVKPYLINDEPAPRTERLQTPEERARYDDSTKCILCGACTGSCPQVWANPRWIGPASIVNAHRFIFDSRDRGSAERLSIMSGYDGVWPCKTIFNCTEACPRGIRVTDTIEQVKRAILQGTNETSHEVSSCSSYVVDVFGAMPPHERSAWPSLAPLATAGRGDRLARFTQRFTE